MYYETIKPGDQRFKSIARAWSPWLQEIGHLYNRYLAEEYPSPFSLHEQATVGLLVSAAARAGTLTTMSTSFRRRGVTTIVGASRAARISGWSATGWRTPLR